MFFKPLNWQFQSRLIQNNAKSIWEGVKIAWVGLLCGFKTKELTQLYARYLCAILCILILTYGMGFVIIIPVYALLWCLDRLLSLICSWCFLAALPSWQSYFYYSLIFSPFFCMIALRTVFWNHCETVYFAVFERHCNPPTYPLMSFHLQSLPNESFSVKLWRLIQRLWIQIVVGLWSYFLSFTPLVGGFVTPVVQFYLTFGLFGYRIAIVLALLSLLPYLQTVSLIILGLVLASNTLVRELLQPYLNRLYQDKNSFMYTCHDINYKSLGFGAFMSCLLTIPILGCLMFPFIQGAAAVLTAKIIDPDELKTAFTKNEGKRLAEEDPPPMPHF